MSYKNIWNGILQFSDDQNEKKLLSDLISNEASFASLEKPHKNVTVSVAGQHNLNIDLMWPVSRVFFFSTDNEEEYQSVKNSDWKCFYAGDAELSWNDIKSQIKEK